MEYYLYNNTTNKLIFNDVGLEIESESYFTISRTLQKAYYSGCSLDDAINNNSLLVTKNDNNPPLEQDILSTTKAKYILSRSDSAFQVHFFDNINLGVNNIQDAIENIITGEITHVVMAQVEEQQPQGIHGGDFISGDWRARNLNTIVFDEIGIDLDNNVITLPNGKYYIQVQAPGYLVGNHQSRIYNTSKIKIGTIATSKDFDRGSPITYSFASDLFIFNNESSIVLQHICDQTNENNGFGRAGNLGTEIYSKMQIWKI